MALEHPSPPDVEVEPDADSPDLIPSSSATRRMAGETTIEFVADMIAGDEITLTKTLTGVTEKTGRSGPLGFVTYEPDYRNATGAPAVRKTYVRILR